MAIEAQTTATTPTAALPEATQADAAATPEAGAQPTQSAPTVADAAAKPAEPAAPAAPKAPEDDPIANAMAELNKMRREVAKAKDTVAAREKEHADKIALAETMGKARAAVASKDFATALQLLAGEGFDLDEASVLLIEQANARDAKPLTQADIERIAAEKVKAERDAAHAAETAKRTAEFEQSKQLYGTACVDAFKADPTKFPLLASRGIDGDRVIEWALSQAAKNGNRVAPTPGEALAHFEAQYVAQFEREAKAMGYTKAEIAAAKAEVAASAGKPAGAAVPIPDTRGAPTERKTTEGHESIAEMTKRHKAELLAASQMR